MLEELNEGTHAESERQYVALLRARLDLQMLFGVHVYSRAKGASRDAYRIWISEIMLQQTQVSRVVPRYLAFLDRFVRL